MRQRYDINMLPGTIAIMLLIVRVATADVCESKINEESCVTEVVCDKYFNLRYYYEISKRCTPMMLYNPNIGNILPIHLVYKRRNEADGAEIPKSIDYGIYYYDYITTLELSRNYYDKFPLIKHMNRLRLLNVSYNSITIAKLSSRYTFPDLEEIDLSHNTIEEFEISAMESPFSSLLRLNVSYNKLNEIKEAVFDRFANLQMLDVSFNEISNINPFSFEGIKNLVYLNLAYNKIDEINGSLFRFTKLTHLNLSNNRIQNILLKDFEKLLQLKELDLSYNALLTIEKKTFQGMSLLTSVYLNNNVLKVLEKEMFHEKTDLKTIDLSYNEIRILPKFMFDGKSIENFDIQRNNLEGVLTNGTFKGLMFILKLDLSYQSINGIDDYAFTGLDKLEELFLNHNEINSVSPKSFDNLLNLKKLHLSNNQIANLDFALNNLKTLKFLSVSYNFIGFIKNKYFNDLVALEYLDISYNNISKIEPKSFENLTRLVDFDVSNNALTDVLESDTFCGLMSIPILDVSSSFLTTIKNSSFNHMLNLQKLNISLSAVNEVNFNAFIHTGNINILDLSHNALKYIDINITTLANLSVLYLNHNRITDLASNLFMNMKMLSLIDLSFNDIKYLNDKTFSNCTELSYLDVSYNKHLNFNVSLMENLNRLNKLLLSGIDKNIQFDKTIDSPLIILNMQNSSVTNITRLGINQFWSLNELILSKNNIKILGVGALTNLTKLGLLDLSFNKIQFIQPGSFKDNSHLRVLNISHNHLTALTYGTFRGLISLETLDLSYNEIPDLQGERFYDIQGLRVLIIDFNKISKIDFESTIHFTSLSIGGNPIPCEILVKLKINGLSITAIKLDEHSNENIDGVSCHGQRGIKRMENSSKSIENNDVLNDIREILISLSERKSTEEISRVINTENDFSQKFEKLITDQTLKMDRNIKNGEEIIRNNNITNSFLERMLKLMVAMNSQATSKQVTIVKENATYENILPYIEQVKQGLESSFTIEKEKIISDFNDKMALINKKLEEVSIKTTEKPVIQANKADSFLFSNICIGLILLILLCFISFKIYESKVMLARRRTISIQRIANAMDNSNL
ncbi:protein artichoke-like [Colias croceus]|uniref:protein artichoke-like n=1 Tax=Colias crocea TaxID=72248 RepID=UPI001E27FE21|nr:protein artichoke-like [Colias croceus]